MAFPICEVSNHNTLLTDITVRVAIRHFARMAPDFKSAIFIDQISRLQKLPSISVSELLGAARCAGVNVQGFHASLGELDASGPFLAYLKRGSDMKTADLVCIEELRSRTAIIGNDRFGTEKISRDQLAERWSGIVLLVSGTRSDNPVPSELDQYHRQISLLPDFLTQEECLHLIEYCEQSSFRRSRVGGQRGGIMEGVVSVKTRSSSSVVLIDRSHPILSRLYKQCAQIEGNVEADIETIQCVRYKRGQRFRAHFDGGVGLPRLTTFLLYLNDNFDGGETYFPMLDKSISPRAGTCLRFPSCTPDGRVIWQSEHGGLPVSRGTKYALNIWVRCSGGLSNPA